MCKVKGCDRDSVYKSQDVCQMHYFRMMRYGTYELTKAGKGADRIVTPNGYVKVKSPGHVLSDNNGFAFEHRINLYESVGGVSLNCHKCGVFWNWRPYLDHVDHIDEDRQNNEISNLRPLCNSCNTRRTKVDYTKKKGCIAVEAFGEVKTPADWAKDDRCNVLASTIRGRIKAGWSAEDSITKPSRKRRGL